MVQFLCDRNENLLNWHYHIIYWRASRYYKTPICADFAWKRYGTLNRMCYWRYGCVSVLIIHKFGAVIMKNVHICICYMNILRSFSRSFRLLPRFLLTLGTGLVVLYCCSLISRTVWNFLYVIWIHLWLLTVSKF